MRSILGWTFLGIVVPIALFAIAAICDCAALAIAAIAIAVVSPAAGHLICRRRLRTRGFYVRLAGAGLCGMLVAALHGTRDLDTAIGAGIALVVIGLGSFATGVALDVVDAQR